MELVHKDCLTDDPLLADWESLSALILILWTKIYWYVRRNIYSYFGEKYVDPLEKNTLLIWTKWLMLLTKIWKIREKIFWSFGQKYVCWFFGQKHVEALHNKVFIFIKIYWCFGQTYVIPPHFEPIMYLNVVYNDSGDDDNKGLRIWVLHHLVLTVCSLFVQHKLSSQKGRRHLERFSRKYIELCPIIVTVQRCRTWDLIFEKVWLCFWQKCRQQTDF